MRPIGLRSVSSKDSFRECKNESKKKQTRTDKTLAGGMVHA